MVNDTVGCLRVKPLLNFVQLNEKGGELKPISSASNYVQLDQLETLTLGKIGWSFTLFDLCTYTHECPRSRDICSLHNRGLQPSSGVH